VATAAAAQPAAAGDTHFAASQNADVQELRDIDFRPVPTAPAASS